MILLDFLIIDRIQRENLYVDPLLIVRCSLNGVIQNWEKNCCPFLCSILFCEYTELLEYRRAVMILQVP